ncbi:hypothetical protein ACJA88_014857 [Fusarium oxysporum]
MLASSPMPDCRSSTLRFGVPLVGPPHSAAMLFRQQRSSRALTAMVILVRPPTGAQPMPEMPQWLINAIRGMMEDGAISDSPPETGTGGSRGLSHELAPRLVPGAGRVGRAGEVCDHESLDGTRVANYLFRGCRDYPSLGGSSLDYYLLVLGSPVPVLLVMAQKPQNRGEASMPRRMVG